MQRAVGEGPSDIHIEPRAKELTVRFRVDGVLREVMSVPSTLQGGVIARLKILGNLDIAERRVPQDGRFWVRSAGQKIGARMPLSMPATKVKKEERTRTGNKAKRELPWNVILHNDWDNSMPRVVIILKKVIPGMTLAKATKIMY